MSKRIKYNDIKEFVEQKNSSFLITTEEDFEKEKKIQKKSALYVKLKYKCNCGETFIRGFDGIKKGAVVCKKCTLYSSSLKQRSSIEDNIKIVESKGLTYVKGEIKNHDTPFTVRCKCGNEFERTIRVIKNNKSEDGMFCDECNKKRLRDKFKLTFNDLKDIFNQKGCVLLSKEEDYKNASSRLKIIAACGHEHETTYTSFRNVKFAYCEECSKYVCSGENYYNWKGGTYNDESIKFRKTFEFKRWRFSVFKRDKFTCRCCNKKAVNINAHHLDGYNWCEEKRVDVNNGVTLCEECHVDFHREYGFGDNTREQYYKFYMDRNY